MICNNNFENTSKEVAIYNDLYQKFKNNNDENSGMKNKIIKNGNKEKKNCDSNFKYKNIFFNFSFI